MNTNIKVECSCSVPCCRSTELVCRQHFFSSKIPTWTVTGVLEGQLENHSKSTSFKKINKKKPSYKYAPDW